VSGDAPARPPPASDKEMRALVVVKTYPNPSQKYGETVCCAAVDMNTREWVRIYPVNFRRLPAKFKKYQVIECRWRRPNNDPRPESRRVDQDSIRLGEQIGTKNGWRDRLRWLPPRYPSVEAVDEEHRASGLSLAVIRPRRITGLLIEKAPPWTAKQLAIVSQQMLNLGESESLRQRELEQVPFKFRYRFWCEDDRCKGHTKQVLDWEIHQSYRRWRREYGRQWEAKLREKYESWMLEKTDLHLVLGTMQKHPDTFTIVGLIYPPRPKVESGDPGQLSLELIEEERAVAG
jgi:hypothetical protein